MRRQLGLRDGRKLDEYLTCVREIERRITRAEIASNDFEPDYEKPTGIPPEYPEHIRLMCDLMVLAMQGDLTRVITFVIADEGSNRHVSVLGRARGTPQHFAPPERPGEAAKDHRDQPLPRHAVCLFARADECGGRRRAVRCWTTRWSFMAAAYPTAIAHNNEDLPIILAGGGAGTIRTGRHVSYNRETPMTNLYLAMLDRLGAPTDRFGDSDGKLELG